MASLKRIYAIIVKELQVILMHPAESKVVVVPPLLFMLIFSLAATRDVKNINIGIYNADNGISSQKIIENIDAADEIFKNVILYSDIQKLEKDLDTQKITLFIRFPEDFSQKNERNETADIQLVFDGRKAASVQIIQGYIQTILTNTFTSYPPLQSPNIIFETRFWYNSSLDYKYFYLPALTCLINMMVVIVISALSIAREKELGTIEQIRISPASAFEVSISKLISTLFIAFVQNLIFIIQAYYIFGIPFEGSVLMLFTGLILFSLGIGSIGLCVSTIASTQQQAFLGSITMTVPFTLLSGFAAPVGNMPLFFQYLSELNPLKHYIALTQAVYLKDISWEDSSVYLVKMLIIVLVLVPICVFMLHTKKE